LQRKYFPRLDGLRALSILLVLTWHSHVSALKLLHGQAGVTVFFVISGFIITTLLLREESNNGRASLRSFYVRRVFRIFPLYYLALLIFSLATFAGFADDAGDYGLRLVHFLTYTNEFATDGTFGHSWSLAIEEKFYFVWPLLAFATPALARFRAWIGVALLAATFAIGLFLPDGYLGIYSPIIAGCVLAILAHRARSYAAMSRTLARPAIALPLFALAVAAILTSPYGHVQVVAGAAVAVAFPALLFGNQWMGKWLEFKPLTYIGRRAYAIYLFHPLVGSALDVALPNSTQVGLQVAHLVLMLVLSVVLAEVLYRVLEKRMIQLGQRLAGRSKSVEGVPSVG
jgi:peptidoglycan/LPS O-acetylase OafA/YrhL